MEHEEVTRKIIGCVFKVYNTMGYGFLESVYEGCMVIEPNKAGLAVAVQKSIPVFYDDQKVGDFVADLIVEDRVIVELKSVQTLLRIHEVQLVNYLVATGLPVGLLVNFGETGVELRRKVRTLNTNGSERLTEPDRRQSCNPVEVFQEADLARQGKWARAKRHVDPTESNQ